MKNQLIFDTDTKKTIERILELQNEGILFLDKLETPSKVELKPRLTKFYEDGYETTLRNLEKTGIYECEITDNRSIETNLDMVIYSGLHNKYYFFERRARFSKIRKFIVGQFIE
jgi:hypothetical protein